MYSESNHIYTNKGLYSVYDVYNAKLNNELNDLQFMSFDIDKYEYKFVHASDMIISNDLLSVYEVVFYDLYSDMNILINITDDTKIFQFDLVDMPNKKYLSANKLKVNQYLQKTPAIDLKFGSKQIKELIDFSVNMPNISLGDSLVRYTSRRFNGTENMYTLIDENNRSIPIFIGQAVLSFYNFVLVQ